jgi:hypothetical protein
MINSTAATSTGPAAATGVGHSTIIYPKLTKFHGYLDDIRIYGRVKTGAECIMITGPAGAGKSQLAISYCEMHPLQELADGDRRPVVTVEAPERGSHRAFAEGILISLGTRPKARGSEETHLKEIVRQFDLQGVELLIVDEAHHLGGHNKALAAEFFKGLLNRTGVPIAFLGMASTEHLNDNLQLQRRCRGVYRLGGFDWHDPQDQLMYRSILKQLEAMMAIKPDGFKLSDVPIARRINYASYGLFGHTGLMLRKFEAVAREQNLTHFTLDTMQQAYAELAIGKSIDPKVAIPRNPFGSAPLPETWKPASHDFGDL